jgi:hypothetical protein
MSAVLPGAPRLALRQHRRRYSNDILKPLFLAVIDRPVALSDAFDLTAFLDVSTFMGRSIVPPTSSSASGARASSGSRASISSPTSCATRSTRWRQRRRAPPTPDPLPNNTVTARRFAAQSAPAGRRPDPRAFDPLPAEERRRPLPQPLRHRLHRPAAMSPGSGIAPSAPAKAKPDFRNCVLEAAD